MGCQQNKSRIRDIHAKWGLYDMLKTNSDFGQNRKFSIFQYVPQTHEIDPNFHGNHENRRLFGIRLIFTKL